MLLDYVFTLADLVVLVKNFIFALGSSGEGKRGWERKEMTSGRYF